MSGIQKEALEYETIEYHTINKMNFFIQSMTYRTLHAHHDIEVVQIISGSLHVETTSEMFDMRRGDVAYFNPYQPHSCHSLSAEPAILLVLHINPDFCTDYFPSMPNLYFHTANLSKIIPADKLEDLKVVCYHIGYNFFGQKNGFEFRCMSDVNRFLDNMLNYVPYHTLSDDLSELSAEHRMERILNYIQDHFADKISLQDIANRENLSTSYLSHFFKKNLHKSFQTYLNELRFEHAVFLLRNTNMKIIDICIESGFSDSKYLNKIFAQVYGTTPRAFRQQYALLDSEATTAQPSDNEAIFNIEDSLQILRENHYYKCDDGFHPNSII